MCGRAGRSGLEHLESLFPHTDGVCFHTRQYFHVLDRELIHPFKTLLCLKCLHQLFFIYLVILSSCFLITHHSACYLITHSACFLIPHHFACYLMTLSACFLIPHHSACYLIIHHFACFLIPHTGSSRRCSHELPDRRRCESLIIARRDRLSCPINAALLATACVARIGPAKTDILIVHTIME